MGRFGRMAQLGGDERGVTAVLTAVLTPVLIGFAGLAIDVGLWQVNLNAMQGMADEAAWAGELEYAAGGTSSYALAARGVAAAQGYVDGVNGVSVVVNNPPQSGTHTTQANAVEVIISAPQSAGLSRLFLNTAPTVTVRTVVGSTGGATCMMSLGTSGTTLAMTGSAAANLNGCDYFNNSTSATSVVMTGSASLAARNVALAGNYVSVGGGTLSASGTMSTATGATTTDPYASRAMPGYSGCTNRTQSITASHKFTSPGSSPTVFCGNVNASGSGTLTFDAGVYIFDSSSLNITGAWTVNATDATLIFTSSSGLHYGTIAATGSATLNLTAPTSGATKGMAIWIDKNAVGSTMTITGATTLNMTGALYAPSSALTISGGGASTCTQYIAYKLMLTGSPSLNHNCAGVGVADVGGVSVLE